MSKINSEETDEEREIRGTDYLAKFIEEYDYNYKAVANSSKSLSVIWQLCVFITRMKSGQNVLLTTG